MLLSSHGVTVAALLLFCQGRIIDGAIYFNDAGQRLPFLDVSTIMQYNSGTACHVNSRPSRPRQTEQMHVQGTDVL